MISSISLKAWSVFKAWFAHLPPFVHGQRLRLLLPGSSPNLWPPSLQRTNHNEEESLISQIKHSGCLPPGSRHLDMAGHITSSVISARVKSPSRNVLLWMLQNQRHRLHNRSFRYLPVPFQLPDTPCTVARSVGCPSTRPLATRLTPHPAKAVRVFHHTGDGMLPSLRSLAGLQGQFLKSPLDTAVTTFTVVPGGRVDHDVHIVRDQVFPNSRHIRNGSLAHPKRPSVPTSRPL